jgi:hypothetical protein
MEKELRRLCNAVVKDENHLEYETKVLGASCVGFIRKCYNVSPIWNVELEELSGVK